MEFKIKITPPAEKELKKLPKNKFKKVTEKIKALKKDPYRGKKLAGVLKGLYSLKIWPYRVIYLVDKERGQVIIMKVGHRQGVYKA